MRFPQLVVAFTCLISLNFFVRAADDSAKWGKEIAAFEAADQASPPSKGAILFIGSSSIRLWKSLAADFPKHKVINRGFGGSQIRDSTHFAERIVWPYEPKQIVMFVGGNDINAGRTPQQCVDDYKAFVAKVREKQTEVSIVYVSIPPAPVRWKQREKIVEANRLIFEFIKTDPKLTFIDVYSKELNDKGEPREELFREDRLHMNADGYKLWTSIIEPYLDPAK